MIGRSRAASVAIIIMSMNNYNSLASMIHNNVDTLMHVTVNILNYSGVISLQVRARGECTCKAKNFGMRCV